MLPVLATLSLLVQFANVALIIRLVVTSGRRPAWMFIAAAMLLAAVLRLVTVVRVFTLDSPPTTLLHEVLVVLVSTLLMVGLYLIRPLMESIRASERELVQSEAQYQALFRDSPLSVIILQQGLIAYANQTALAVLGGRLEEIAGQPLMRFVGNGFQTVVREQLELLSEDHPSFPITEIQVRRNDGTTIDAEILIALFVYAGHLAPYLILWDVSERKRREETLREREAELAHVTRLHTMGEIAAEMAHEINQPLYAISNFAQAGVLHLQSGEPERLAQLQVCLEHIHTQAGRAGQIVKNLRDFVSKSEVVLDDVSVNKLVQSAVELVAFETRRHRALVQLQLCPQDGTVHVNSVQLQQVLVNLLVNAVEAMETVPEPERIVIVITRVAEDRAEIAVEDAGPGVDEDKLTRVFEPFYTTKPKGMGMGLAVSRTIVINHGGRIHAERNARGGTTFRVQLPLKGVDVLLS